MAALASNNEIPGVQFKARLTGPGMRWSRAGAERMLVIRSSILSDSFDDLWNLAA